jgi:hypothetical protein
MVGQEQKLIAGKVCSKSFYRGERMGKHLHQED